MFLASPHRNSRRRLAPTCVLILSIMLHALAAAPQAAPAVGAEPTTGKHPSPQSHPTSSTFLPARPGYMFQFPRDHGTHQGFHTEWWYYTGHLRTDEGRTFGYQLTFFRRAIHPPSHAAASTSAAPATETPTTPSRSAWRIDDLYLAHVALSDPQTGRFRFAETISREGLGKAGAARDHLDVWIDRWRAAQLDDRRTADAPHSLAASGSDFSLALTVTLVKPPVVHGTDGVSRKGPQADHASHYYSLTRLATEGTLTLDGRPLRVVGTSWMDHEFGSGELSDSIVGWDWFSVQLHSGEELMLYRLRQADGTVDPASSGTWIDHAGQAHPLTAEDIQITALDHWTSPTSQARYPSRWRVAIPSRQIELDVTPRMADQELRTPHSTRVTYWEGAVTVTGTVQGAAAPGDGYVELTGYAERYRPRL